MPKGNSTWEELSCDRGRICGWDIVIDTWNNYADIKETLNYVKVCKF